jgi:hypothetical protein
MKERLDKSGKGQTAITFLSGSAGELDWVLPILDFLLNKGFNIKIIFLTRGALKSVERNRMCNDFIRQKNHKIEVPFYAFQSTPCQKYNFYIETFI